MSAPTFTVESSPDRLDIACDACGSGMNSPANDFGASMVESFKQIHKCPKVKK